MFVSSRRFEMLLLSVLLLTIGEVMIASSNNVSVYTGAQVFWAFGYIGALDVALLFARQWV